VDAVEKQQLKQTQSGEVAKADVIREYQQKRMQSGSSSWSGHNQGAVQCDHTRLVLARDTTTQGCWWIRVGTGAAPD